MTVRSSAPIHRRDYHPEIPQSDLDNWHAQGPVATQFLNTLSVLFPRGERFFIDAVRAHKDHPNVASNPVLMAQIKGFIGQEAMHTREHKLYNDRLKEAGLRVDPLLREIDRTLDFARDKLPIKAQLAATIALEHFTAIMADRLLKDDRVIETLDVDQEGFKNLWTWHAIEETEHKGVAYDVWKSVYGTNPVEYLHRSGYMVVTSAIFFAVLARFHWYLVKHDSKSKAFGRLKGYRNLAKIFFGEIGFVSKNLGPYMDYFKYKFHPWDHENTELLVSHKQRLELAH